MKRWSLLGLLALALCFPTTAAAHSALVESSPAIDAIVEEAPDEVVMRFSDPVTVPDGVVSVRDLTGREYVAEGVTVDDSTVTIPLDDTDASGTRVVTWSAISDHGTVISGSFVYHVGQPTPGAKHAAATVGGDPVRQELTDLFRATTWTSLAVAFATALAWLMRRRRPTGAAALRAMLIGVVVVTALATAGGFFAAAQADWLIEGASEPVPARVEQSVSLGDGANATVTLDPVVAGMTDVLVDVRTADGSLDADAQEAHIRYRPANKRMGYFRTDLTRDGAGRFSIDDMTVPYPGVWEFEVTVSADAFSASLARFTTTFHPNPELDR